MSKLNLGCGSNKLEGYINIDVEESCKPDQVCDFTKDFLPFDNDSIDEIVLFHTIEHIQKRKHKQVLSEIFRVLKPNAEFIVSFPEFVKCFNNWNSNKNGNREFWENTLFGRQLYPSDHHVCIMDSIDFKQTLIESGFGGFSIIPEPAPNEFNTVIYCYKNLKIPSYEQRVQEATEDILLTRD